MFNLLPEEQKKLIYKEYRMRLLTLVFFFLGFLGVIFFVVLTPSFFAINLKHSSLIDRQARLQEANPELLNIKELEAKVTEQKNKLQVANAAEEKLFSEIVEAVLRSKVSGIELNSISFDRREDNVRIELKGNALRRDQLLSFSKKIQEEEMFSDVNLPVSDLAKDQNLEFSMSFVVVFKNEKKPR